MRRSGALAIGTTIFFGAAFLLALSFALASIQGDYGLFRRAEIEAEIRALEAERDALEHEVAALRNRTRRLSDDWLDLDLLDERTRAVLGYVRGDEIVLP